MKTYHLSTGIILTCLLSISSAQAVPIEEQVQSVVSHLVGVMDTSTQAANNPKKSNVRMTTCKITITQAPNSVYLYQEQALTQKLDKPYRQRILQIKPSSDNNTIESKSYKPQHPETLIGLCNKPETERILNLTDIGESVCSVFLKPSQEGYTGETPPQGCPANVRGAVRITNTIILRSDGMDTWDRGYDAQGNQVWGADGESYQYRWVKN